MKIPGPAGDFYFREATSSGLMLLPIWRQTSWLQRLVILEQDVQHRFSYANDAHSVSS